MMKVPPSELRERALALIRAEYDSVASFAKLPLETVNRGAPADLPYRSTDEVVDEWTSRATAMATFAVNLGVITREDAQELIVSFFERHPELLGHPPPRLDQDSHPR